MRSGSWKTHVAAGWLLKSGRLPWRRTAIVLAMAAGAWLNLLDCWSFVHAAGFYTEQTQDREFRLQFLRSLR